MQDRHGPDPARLDQGMLANNLLLILVVVDHDFGLVEILRIPSAHQDISGIRSIGGWHHDMGDVEVGFQRTHRHLDLRGSGGGTASLHLILLWIKPLHEQAALCSNTSRGHLKHNKHTEDKGQPSMN